MNTEFDCQKCGACCQDPQIAFRYQSNFVHLTPSDISLLSPEERKQYTKPIKSPYFSAVMCLNGTQCAALQGQIGSDVACAIYKNRPDICRKFEIGSDCCLLAREEAGLSPFKLDRN